MKLIQSSDYRIYFDDVRMDPYIKTWNAQCGLRLSDATASITMHRTKKLEEWKAYLTQVRIFVRNVFSGKFAIVFEGEIMNRGWGDARNDTGEITFQCKGFYHWLDIPIPFLIGQEDSFDYIQRFRYEAQNIDVEGMASLQQTKADLMMKDKAIDELIKSLFEVMSQGYHLNDDSTYNWAKVENRFKVMADIVKEFREAGFLDSFTFVKSTQIESFYVYLNQVLTQMMFEFYQDRDGAFRIKVPSWGDNILKTHILDESVVENASGFNDWENEPTRVLVIGGQQDLARTGSPALGMGNVMKIPMGLYIGLPGEGEYYSELVELAMQQPVTATTDTSGGSSDGTGIVMGSDGMFQSTGVADGPVHGVKWPKLSHELISGQTNIHPILMERLVKISKAYNNQKISITDGGRTYEQQVDVKRRKPTLAAKPGTSNHEIGTAVDVGQGWLRPLRDKDLEPYGLYKSAIGKGEDWHIDLIENKGRSNEETIKVLGGLSPRGGSGNAAPASSDTSGSSGGTSAGLGSGSVEQYVNQNLRNQSNWNADQLNSWINTKAPKDGVMYGRGAAFAEAAKASGLDPIYLVSHAAHETGWGNSSIAKKKYNFYGIGAFDSSPYSSAKTWDGPDGGIINGAIWIRKNFYDKGQTTLYTMRFSPSGSHNYATDPAWHTKIASTMRAAGVGPGEAGGSANSIANGVAGFNRYLGTPYAATGGYTFTTRYVPTTTSGSLKDLLVTQNTPKPVDANAFSSSQINYILPKYGMTYKDTLTSRPNGININMLCCVIEAASNWQPKNKSGDHYGLMGVPKNYIDSALGGSTKQIYEPEFNIQHGTKLMAQGLSKFSKKYTFAIATLYLGSTKTLEEAVKQGNSSDFNIARAFIDQGAASFVDKVVEKFTAIYQGNTLTNDFHKKFIENPGLDSNSSLVDSASPAEYESSYKPIISDEERLYKVNLKISEQSLIRYDIATQSSTDSASGTTTTDDSSKDDSTKDDSTKDEETKDDTKDDNTSDSPKGDDTPKQTIAARTLASPMVASPTIGMPGDSILQPPVDVTPTDPNTSIPGLEKPKDPEIVVKPEDLPEPDEDSVKVPDEGEGDEQVNDEDSAEKGTNLNADELIERYARYMMQLYRAESHSVSVRCSTCLPFLRPGYNAWLEPTRRDMVFYITRVGHQGGYQQNSFSTVSGGFVRSPKDFNDIEENIFVGTMNSEAADFGEVVTKDQMDSVRKELKSLHEQKEEVISDARKVPTLSKMYSSGNGADNDYTTMWNNEMSAVDLEKELTTFYEDAPAVVKDRKKKLKKIVDEGAEFFKKMLLQTPFQ